uniref:LEM domain-containing protein n=1 Tax=Amazona collaria TaxID=241587 RepID=A0A8B9IS30_9PSIT
MKRGCGMDTSEPGSAAEEEEERAPEPRPRTRSNPEGAEDRALSAQSSVGNRSEGEGEAASADGSPQGTAPAPHGPAWPGPGPHTEVQVKTPRVNCPEKVIICLDLAEEMALPKLESFNGSKTNALNISQKMIEMFVRTKHKIDKCHEFALVVVNNDATWLSGFTSDPREVCSCLYDLETVVCKSFNLEGLFNLIQQKIELPVTENVQTIPPPYVVRTILVFGRPGCQPQFSMSEHMKKMLQCPYFFFDVVYIHNGVEEKDDETSWKVNVGWGILSAAAGDVSPPLCPLPRRCTASSAAWTPKAPTTSTRCCCRGRPWSCTTAWPSCWRTRCSAPSRHTQPTGCWRRMSPRRSRPPSDRGDAGPGMVLGEREGAVPDPCCADAVAPVPGLGTGGQEDGKRAMDRERGHGVRLLRDWGPQRAWGWSPAEDPEVLGSSLSFLTEDATKGSICAALPEAGSLLQEPGGCSGLRGPLPSLSIPSLAPWPQGDPGGSAVPPHPLASSTLLSDGDELREGPRSRTMVGGSGGPPQVLPQPCARVAPGPRPPQVFGPGGSLRPPQRCTGALGKLGALAEAPGHGGSAGDSSSDSECFLSALETLGARCCSAGLEPGEAPSPDGAGAGATELPPPSSPPTPERVQGGGFAGASGAAPCCEDASGDVGELLTQLQGCSLQGSPPCTPGPLPRLITGGVIPQEPLVYPHVTPRTRSRLLASAKRFGASSSSSLFGDTLEMPRRPPRVRAPQGVPRDPATTSGRCGTPQGTDVCSGDREETGSVGDTVLLPRAPSSSPGASPTVLLVPGGPQCPPSDAQGSPGSSPTVLLIPDHPQCPPSDAQGSPGSSPTMLLIPDHPQCPPSDAQGSSGSSPTVLLVPGGPQCPPSDAQGSSGSSPTALLVPGRPQCPPADAQGSSGSSPTALLIPGDPQCPPSDAQGSSGSSPTALLIPGHPQCPPADAQGSPCATFRVPEGGSGCQDPLPLETPQPLRLHRRFCRLLAPRAPAVPPGPQEHLECEERDRAPTERHSPGHEDTAPPRPLSDEGLRRRLRALGDEPGPITALTRQLYLRRLEKLLRTPRNRPVGACGVPHGLAGPCGLA